MKDDIEKPNSLNLSHLDSLVVVVWVVVCLVLTLIVYVGLMLK